jgi:transcription initiation factor IIE alpha subunit
VEIENEILVNKYVQSVVDVEDLIIIFNSFSLDNKKKYLNDLLFFILQSKAQDEDIEPAIEKSKLRRTYTPCVIIQKGVGTHNLKRLLNLPENELNKSLILLLNLFKIAYMKRFETEKKDTYKWWYWDLSDDENIETILKIYK